jgi:hypothetical protein
MENSTCRRHLFSWLKDKGFNAELSTCGRLAKQMHSQLRGWTSVLTNEPLLSLFDTMARGGEDGKGAPLGEVKNRIKNMVRWNNRLYESLVERNVFQLGYKTHCPHCGRASWFSVNDLAAELTCPLCFKNLDAISAVDKVNQGANGISRPQAPSASINSATEVTRYCSP